MSEQRKPTRRRFVKFCAAAVGAGGLTSVPASNRRPDASVVRHRRYNRVRLVDAENRPIRARHLMVGESYLFHYPYVATPCFLLDLGRPTETPDELKTADDQSYRWQQGVGAQHSVVAFSAICAHKMSHPARSISFINYRHERVKFWKLDHQMAERDRVIFCCSEKSVYDATAGGRVVGGPAPQPLAGITLEHDDSDDGLYATGTFGGEMFHRFFDKFGHRLQIEYGLPEVHAQVTRIATVVPITEFCAQRVLCG